MIFSLRFARCRMGVDTSDRQIVNCSLNILDKGKELFNLKHYQWTAWPDRGNYCWPFFVFCVLLGIPVTRPLFIVEPVPLWQLR
ncbi:unnamed protein product, partial [Mesorhabditis belari]|uniref:Bicarbonate transporter-like transmembrane domain-containing protein n=1 Tax=Mesorhabditis belari TaxID=2138241 RepID=A0AAF3ELB2_9BILA